MRELSAVAYDAKTYTDDNLLYKHRLLDPQKITNKLIYLWGKDSEDYPLLTNTMGQGAIMKKTPKKLGDTQFTWDVMGKMKYTIEVVSLQNTSITTPGLGNSVFEVLFRSNLAHAYFSMISPDQKWTVRVQGEPKKVANNLYRARVSILAAAPTDYVSLDNFQQGKFWTLGATSIAANKSDGTATDAMFPGEWTSQYGFYRYSMPITGNIANKVVPFEFETASGGKTNLWIPFQFKQFEMRKNVLNEQDLWMSEYNRNSQGEILDFDEETGEPIPRTAGVKDVLNTIGNIDTYYILTKAKMDNTIKSVFNMRTDKSSPMEIVLYTGRGGAEMFHDAIMRDALTNQYYFRIGESAVTGGSYLSYGAYFNQYKTIDGKVITVKVTDYFDNGPLAQQDKANGRMYNGYPWYSYNLVFLDHSQTADGERNIQVVVEEGRESITGVYRGMTPLPGAWGAFGDGKTNGSPILLSTRKDMAAYEVMGSQGLAFLNGYTSFWLEFMPD